MAAIVNIDGISQAAKTYDPVLRVLPFTSLSEVGATLGLNIQEVENEDVVTNFRRKAGGTGAYKPGMEINYKAEIGKFFETTLKPQIVVSKTKDNISRYSEKKILMLAGKQVDNKSKKHPLEQLIVMNEIKSHGEDVVYSLFFAERDETAFNPMAAFDGFFTKLDLLVTGGLISAGNKNLATTGEFAMPVDENDTDAYENLVEFLGSSHNLLRSSVGGAPLMTTAQTVIKAARAALRNKLKSFDYPDTAKLLESIREDAFIPGLQFNTHEALGTGSKVMLHKPGLFDVGFNTKSAAQFCQVRPIYEDPNEFQFWIQAAYDTRISDVHPKLFRMNEQTNTALDLAGDY